MQINTKQEVIDKLKSEYKYKVIYDIGKPYEVLYNTDKALQEGLKQFYEEYVDEDFCGDIMVLNSSDDNISENQFIKEMISEIMGED